MTDLKFDIEKITVTTPSRQRKVRWVQDKEPTVIIFDKNNIIKRTRWQKIKRWFRFNLGLEREEKC